MNKKKITTTDGIGEAEDIIKSFGGKVENGVITIKDYPERFNEALKFLRHEWDYEVIVEDLEEWVDVQDFEDTYEVNRAGKVRNKRTKNIMAEYTSGNLYPYVQLNKDGKTHKLYVHRLIVMHWIPNPGNRGQVNHKDLNKHNNHISNLEWVTPKENSVHAAENGAFDGLKEIMKTLKKKKPRKGRILKKEQVQSIKKLYEEGVSKTYISKMFKISLSRVTNIIEGEKYAHYDV